MEIRDIEAFIKEQKDLKKWLDKLLQRANQLAVDGMNLREEIVSFRKASGAATPAPKQTRAAAIVTPQRVVLVEEAVRDILKAKPYWAFKPTELEGTTGLQRRTIGAIFRHLGYTLRGGKWSPPPQGDGHAATGE